MIKNLKFYLYFFVSFFLALCLNTTVFAEEAFDGVKAEQQIDELELEPIQDIIDGSELKEKFDFKELLLKTVKGEMDFSVGEILKVILNYIFEEVVSNSNLLKNIIIVCILSGIVRILTESFKNRESGELAFYVSFIVVVTMLLASFSICAEIFIDTADVVGRLMQGVLPVIISLLIMSGNSMSAYVFHPIILGAVEITVAAIKNLFMPLLMAAAVMEIVNYLTYRQLLSKFSAFVKGIVTWGIRVMAIVFMAVLSLQKMSTGVLNTAVNKTAKFAVNMVPVVGDVLSGSVDTVMVWTQSVKSGISVTVILAVIAICSIPIIKICAIILMYKFTAAIIQPVCDRRITDCIDSVGQYAVVILTALVTVILMFIFGVMITLSASGL